MTLAFLLALAGTLLLVALAIIQLIKLRKAQQKVDGIGRAIAGLESKNRRMIIYEINKIAKELSPWTLLVMANRYQWSPIVISSLPKLYFTKKVKSNTYAYAWKQTLNLMSPSFPYKVLASYCDGQILKIKFSNETAPVFEQIALRIETARATNPYPSYSSLIGVINQFMNEYELEMKEDNATKLAELLQHERKLLLENELNLSVLG